MHTLKSVERVEEAKHFLASIIESSKDSIISVNFEGIITSWNKAAELLYGYRGSRGNRQAGCDAHAFRRPQRNIRQN